MSLLLAASQGEHQSIKSIKSDWIETEHDAFDMPHARHRTRPCPNCSEPARESECFDVGGHWIICLKWGVID